VPKIESKELQREALSNSESLMKMKLLDFTEKITNMSAVEFDSICKGRIEKQTEESCFTISKVLFQGIKIGEKIMTQREKNEQKGGDNQLN